MLLPGPLVERLRIDSTRALAVRSLERHAPAESGGLRIGDLLLYFEGERIEMTSDLHRRLDGPSSVGAAPASCCATASCAG